MTKKKKNNWGAFNAQRKQDTINKNAFIERVESACGELPDDIRSRITKNWKVLKHAKRRKTDRRCSIFDTAIMNSRTKMNTGLVSKKKI